MTVTTSPLVKRYSLREFWDLPAPEGGGRYELIAGVLYMVPPPAGPHIVVITRLNEALVVYLAGRPGFGRVFFPPAALWTEADTYLEPDLMFVRSERLQGIDPGHLPVADLVVEALSPGTKVYDRTTKADTYAFLGVKELWLIDPEAQTIEQRVLRDGVLEIARVLRPGDTLRSDLLPGFACDVASLFLPFA